MDWNSIHSSRIQKTSVVETNDYKELIFRLNYLVQTKGFGVLTGGPGRGKTTMIRHWVKSLNQSAYKVIYIPMSTLNSDGIL